MVNFALLGSGAPQFIAPPVLAQFAYGFGVGSLLGIGLIFCGLALYLLRSMRPNLARDHDIFFAAVSLLCGGILFFQGWRLDPILQFGQFLMTGSAIFFAVESIRLRSVVTQQAKRNTPIVDDDRPVSSNYRTYDAELEEIEPYEAPSYPPLRRIAGSRDPRRPGREAYGYEDDYERGDRPARRGAEPGGNVRGGASRPKSGVNPGANPANPASPGVNPARSRRPDASTAPRSAVGGAGGAGSAGSGNRDRKLNLRYDSWEASSTDASGWGASRSPESGTTRRPTGRDADSASRTANRAGSRSGRKPTEMEATLEGYAPYSPDRDTADYDDYDTYNDDGYTSDNPDYSDDDYGNESYGDGYRSPTDRSTDARSAVNRPNPAVNAPSNTASAPASGGYDEFYRSDDEFDTPRTAGDDAMTSAARRDRPASRASSSTRAAADDDYADFYGSPDADADADLDDPDRY